MMLFQVLRPLEKIRVTSKYKMVISKSDEKLLKT